MSENNNEEFLKINDLVVQYTSEDEIIHAVNGVSLELKKGKTLGLVGETGAGKTTIAKSIMRLLPIPPAQLKGGEIFFEGKDLMQATDEEMRHICGEEIAMIFQDPMTALNPLMTVGDQISEVVELHNPDWKKDQITDRAMDMLEMVGIPRERYVEYPHQFSGGMKQRVVIAIALACDPELLLADEPTTALDVTIQAQVLDLINELKVKQNTSMLLITHDLGVVAQTCDDVAVIYAGQIMESGSKEKLFLHPTHPYTIGLFNSLPEMNTNSKRLKPIRGMMRDPALPIDGCPFYDRCDYATDACKSGEIPMQELAPEHFCRCINRKEEGEEWIL